MKATNKLNSNNKKADSSNLLSNRRLLKNQLAKESKIVAKTSMRILHQFESLTSEFSKLPKY